MEMDTWSILPVNNFYFLFRRVICLFLLSLLLLSCSKKSSKSYIVRAITDGDFYALRSMVERGIDVNETFERSRTPLMYAVMSCRADMTDYLIEKGADIEAMDIDGDTVVVYATRAGYDIIVDLLIEKGADINLKNRAGKTPLFLAARNGYSDIAKKLVKAGADPRNGGDWRNMLKNAEALKEVRDITLSQPGIDLKSDFDIVKKPKKHKKKKKKE